MPAEPARRFSVYAIAMDGLRGRKGTLRRLGPAGELLQPMIDGAGKSVVCWGRAEGAVGYEIWRIDLCGEAVRLTDLRGVASHPFWSADGRRIVFSSTHGLSDETEWSMAGQFQPGRSPRNLWLMDRDGGNPRRLTEGAHVDERPCLSPNGRTAVFVSDRSGAMNLWSVETETGKLRQVTRHGGMDYRPAVSPDGKTLAYFTTESPHGIRDLCLMDLPGGERRFPVRPGLFRWIHGPSWLADGRRLLIHGESAADGSIALWRLDLRDGGLARLDLPGVPSHAHGSLDAAGTTLAFDSLDPLG